MIKFDVVRNLECDVSSVGLGFSILHSLTHLLINLVFSEKLLKQSQDFVRRNYVTSLYCKLLAVLTGQGDMMEVPAETGEMIWGPRSEDGG